MSFVYQSTIDKFDWEKVNQDVEAFCCQNEVPVASLYSFQLIIEELVTNIIKYGKCTGDEQLIIESTIEDARIKLTISDNTSKFNPLEAKTNDTELAAEDRSIGGLGLVLVKQKSKSISYAYENGFNVVKIEI